MSVAPRRVKFQSLKNQIVITDKCYVAERFVDRLRGLIGKATWSPGEGMYFPRCSSIHMWFMKIAIDVVFLKRNNDDRFIVTSIRKSIPAWKIVPLLDMRATDTLELPVGTIDRCRIQVEDELCLS